MGGTTRCAAIGVDAESMEGTGRTLCAASTPPLPSPSTTSRASIDAAAGSVREAWHTDLLGTDSADLGRRVSATVADFASVEQDAVRDLRALEALLP